MRLLNNIILVSFFVFASYSAQAQMIESSLCSLKVGDSDRLKCYDAAANAAKLDSASMSPTTKEIVNSKISDSAKVIDAEDLFIAPNKFTGKHVELRQMQCFHADKDEYRCISKGGFALMIMTIDVSPSDAKDQIERDCGQIKKVITAPCRKTIRFVPAKSQQDEINAMSKRTVVLTTFIEVVGQGKKR